MKNHLIYLAILACCMAFSVSPASAIVSERHETFQSNNFEKTTSLKKTRLFDRFKQKQAIRAVEKVSNEGMAKETNKLQIVAFLLCFFLGVIGIHRFYLGYNGMGVIYILTLGLFGIGVLIDFILLIIPNGLTPKGHDSY